MNHDCDNIETLRRLVNRYAAVPSSEWQVFMSFLTGRVIVRSEHLLIAGNVPRSLAFVCRGILRRYVVREDGEHVDTFLAPGSFATDYSSLVEQVPSSYSIQSLQDSYVVEVGYEELRRLFHRHPCWQEFTVKAGSYLQRKRQEEKLALQSESAETRYAKLVKACPEVVSQIPQYHVASYLGITPESLSRIRRRRADRAS